MTELTRIKNKIKRNKKILHEYNISKIGIFGSYARNEAKKKSDVDLLVEFSEVIDLFSYARLQQKIEKILAKKVDLAMPEALKPLIKENILKEVTWIEGF